LFIDARYCNRQQEIMPRHTRNNYAVSVTEMHVSLVNLSAAFHQETHVPVHAQLLPLIDALSKVIDDASAFRKLTEDTLRSARPTAAVRQKKVAAGLTDSGDDADRSSALNATEDIEESDTAAAPRTLRGIASKYRVDASELRTMNPHLAQYGDDTVLPRHTPVSLHHETHDAAPAAETASTTDDDVDDVVSLAAPMDEPYDTVRNVAERGGVSVQDLLRANEVTLQEFSLDQPLPPGIDLRLPVAEDGVCVTQRGDTVSLLATEMACTMNALVHNNEPLRAFHPHDLLPMGTRVIVPLRHEEEPRRFQSVTLRAPCMIGEVADDHRCSVAVLVDANAATLRGADLRQPLRAGTVIAVPH
jgi:LysM repeat protein